MLTDHQANNIAANIREEDFNREYEAAVVRQVLQDICAQTRCGIYFLGPLMTTGKNVGQAFEELRETDPHLAFLLLTVEYPTGECDETDNKRLHQRSLLLAKFAEMDADESEENTNV
jgi:hypothetical protein